MGYSNNWVGCADTTNFVFLSFLFNNDEIDPSALKLNEFVTSNGSFSTYFR
ncbi:hypothetical protein [Flavobacterium sp. LAR06]|uniref:hypothetical protein n=1 Tax=Flavobacterium sp. LAR06 TaxID=3064897 RepID=UPI0035C03186